MTLPQGWAETTLGRLVEVNPKHGADIDRTVSVSFVPMPVVDEVTGRITDPIDRPLDEVWKGYTHFSDGDVIFAKITPCMENGKSAIASRLTNGLACGSTEFFVFRSQGAVEPAYLWRFLRQTKFREEAAKVMTGAVGQRRVPRAWLENYKLGVPPLAEQRRIVVKLDALTARLARARAEAARAVELACRLREQVQASGSVAGAVLLEELLSAPLRNGLSIKGSDQPPGVPALRLSALREQIVNLDDVRYLDVPTTRAETYRLKPDDVLVSRGNGTLRLVGRASRVAVTPADLTIFPDTAFRIRLDPARASARWFTLVWNSPLIRTQIEARARTTAGIWKISQRDLNEIELPDVALHEQLEWVEKVDAAFARADRLEAEAKKALALIDRLEAAILARAFRGELVPQDPNDEPASVLLERIRARRAAEPKPKRGRRPKLAS